MRNQALNNLKFRLERLWRINTVSSLISRLDPNKVEDGEYQDALAFITATMSEEMTELEEVYCEIEEYLTAKGAKMRNVELHINLALDRYYEAEAMNEVFRAICRCKDECTDAKIAKIEHQRLAQTLKGGSDE